ncbi:TetR/AcrR family transcriptional regulator [Micromonospora sp. NBC_01638]|uniref:TetR/AcrR family transcriptional regulator n=1 Tax=Micromonospora sp. NBC_01638 TaxID=2975982 RepID=UPI00386434D1|nr:TetR/AcrR family transcriptional regulator [Micromonospora sp. NBC_01638]
MKASGVRARVRAEMVKELKAVAWRHLAAEGSNLSLRAVARDMGMASSAVYRYFPSRDDLLTALIIDAYDALGESAESAAEKAEPGLERWLAVGHAVRDWALAAPHEWALIYGSPVPGYRAPEDTIGPGVRVILLIGRVLKEALRAGLLELGEPLTGEYAEELAAVAARLGDDMPPRLVADSAAMFFMLCGAVNAELFGQLTNSVDRDRRGFFAFQLGKAATLAGLTA